MTSCAILGGSFDPIHNGHLHIARQVLNTDWVDCLAFVPSARHNFKGNSIRLDFVQRCRLIQCVLEPGMELWLDDATGSGYTSDLMQSLLKKHPDKRFFFAIGADNLSSLPRWHDFPWLRDHLEFLVLERPDYPLEQSVLSQIKATLLSLEPCDISSTRIRELISQGGSIQGLVPDPILTDVLELYLPLLRKDASSD